MSAIKVLIVDDSVVIRKLLSDTLAGQPDIEVVGTAANGRIGLARITQLNPDVVTMDVEMPDMDGFATLAELRKTWPKLPVIMFSTLTARGADATLTALSLGASDYVTKPANVGSVQEGMERVRTQLVPKIRALAGRSTLGAAVRAFRRPPPPRLRHAAIKAVVIGCSTGGPNALAELIPALQANFPVPVAIVQHMPPMFTKSLADRLNARSPLHVAEAEEGNVFAPGKVLIAPGGAHIVVDRGDAAPILRLSDAPPENSCRPAADVLFRSAAEHFGAALLAVVLTGMGQDGLRGCEAVRERGGTVFAQDEASSVVWGMPGQVVHAGLADKVLPLAEIAQAIVQRVHMPAASSVERVAP